MFSFMLKGACALIFIILLLSVGSAFGLGRAERRSTSGAEDRDIRAQLRRQYDENERLRQKMRAAGLNPDA